MTGACAADVNVEGSSAAGKRPIQAIATRSMPLPPLLGWSAQRLAMFERMLYPQGAALGVVQAAAEWSRSVRYVRTPGFQ